MMWTSYLINGGFELLCRCALIHVEIAIFGHVCHIFLSRKYMSMIFMLHFCWIEWELEKEPGKHLWQRQIFCAFPLLTSVATSLFIALQPGAWDHNLSSRSSALVFYLLPQHSPNPFPNCALTSSPLHMIIYLLLCSGPSRHKVPLCDGQVIQPLLLSIHQASSRVWFKLN